MTAFTHSLAAVIGVDAYGPSIPRLTTAVNDATRLAALLQAEHGYETILLTQEATGQPITQERLRTLFNQELAARLGPDDRLLVYFAGHGVALDGDDGPAGYLVPQDARPDDPSSLLAMTDLHKWLTDLPCRHMLAILDCCFAGAFRWAVTRHLGALTEVIHKERFERYLQSPAWQVITSASYDQKALDILTGSVANSVGTRHEDGRQHSPFAQALFDALQGAGDLVPKGQGDGVITASELALYLRQAVEVAVAERADMEQTPQLWPLNKHRKGEYIFLVPGHVLNLPSAEALTEQNNPYRGLRPYEREHRELFFGRQEEIEALRDLLEGQPFVAVLGASGTGKSSLVKAGLLPRLKDAGEQWQVLPPIRPTDHPVQTLAVLLRGSLPGVPDALEADAGLAQAVAVWQAANPQKRLVLTVDQCEESSPSAATSKNAHIFSPSWPRPCASTPTSFASSSRCAPTSSRSSPTHPYSPLTDHTLCVMSSHRWIRPTCAMSSKGRHRCGCSTSSRRNWWTSLSTRSSRCRVCCRCSPSP